MAQAVSAYPPTEPQGIEHLIELALDLRGTWEHSADELWGQLDPELWALTLNPWAVLQAVSHARLKALAADPEFRRKAAALVRARRQYFEAPTWFQRWHADGPLTCATYFSPVAGEDAFEIHPSGAHGGLAGLEIGEVPHVHPGHERPLGHDIPLLAENEMTPAQARCRCGCIGRAPVCLTAESGQAVSFRLTRPHLLRPSSCVPSI
jgi:hypothetical protein